MSSMQMMRPISRYLSTKEHIRENTVLGIRRQTASINLDLLCLSMSHGCICSCLGPMIDAILKCKLFIGTFTSHLIANVFLPSVYDATPNCLLMMVICQLLLWSIYSYCSSVLCLGEVCSIYRPYKPQYLQRHNILKFTPHGPGCC